MLNTKYFCSDAPGVHGLKTELLTMQHHRNSSSASRSLSGGTDLLCNALVPDKSHYLFPRQSAAGCVFTVCMMNVGYFKEK